MEVVDIFGRRVLLSGMKMAVLRSLCCEGWVLAISDGSRSR